MLVIPLPSGWSNTVDVSKLLTSMRLSMPSLLSIQVADALICSFSGPDPAVATVQAAIPGVLPTILPPTTITNLQSAVATLLADATTPPSVKTFVASLKAYLGV